MRLTDRRICNYFKERIVVKSHKSDEVIRNHCVTIDFAEDLMGSEGGISMVDFPVF